MAVGELKSGMRVLTVNAGSTSLKLERYDLGEELQPLAEPPAPSFACDVAAIDAERVLHEAARDSVDVVAHRFVRLPDGSAPVLRLNAEAIAAIRSVGGEAPLHDGPALDAVATIGHARPDVPQYAVSDSAFHRTIPPAAATYAIPAALTRSGLRRLGYHGLSHEYAAHRGCALAGLDVAHARVITAHLGGGSSLCAIRGGASVDTTMGYTPLEGLPMATRSGSVDPGILIHLLRTGMSVDLLEQMLERRSGLLGISGISEDVRQLLAARDRPEARLALDVLAWRLRSALGAMSAVLGGADLIVFTGGIGENAQSVRAEALDGGLGLDICLDAERNATIVEGRIDNYSGATRVCVVTAREGWQLARAAIGRGNRLSKPIVAKQTASAGGTGPD